MSKYFAFIDGEQRGPFPLEDLVKEGVRPSTYVWCKDMDDWHRADEVPEVCRLFRQHLAEKMHPTAPVLPPNSTAPVGPAENADTQQQQPQPLRFPIRESELPEADYNNPPQVSMTLAVLSLILCFIPTGIVAVIFTYKARKTWEEALNAGEGADKENLKRQSHEYERLAKMWLGLTVAFGIIFWTLIFSIPK